MLRPTKYARNEERGEAAGVDWKLIISRYQRPDTRRAMTQLATTLLPLAAVFFLMYRSVALSYWATLALALPAAGLLVRTFIIMHDCAHGSFLPSKRANTFIGWATGVLTLTPFGQWRHDHSLHHASSGDLDRRGHGDVETLTVDEYQALPLRGRLRYRMIRNPLVLFGLGPIHWVLTNRIPPHGPDATARQRRSVWGTNALIVAGIAAAIAWVGLPTLLLVYGVPMYLAAAGGIWLFYVQHQFEGTYWRQHAEWDYVTSAIRGSSYLKLPAVLHWFTGSIGLHHVHHLGPRIPNYALMRCHAENPLFHDVTTLTLAQSVRTLRLTLWDETRQQLVGFRDLRTTRPAKVA
ncbi:MAG TPA: fatty acid desaturase [Gemmatimonadaceae bacterium]|jgi:omega-6 fatty acid desaturase (delta-12 desaturase)|nr:fatty acid desaturase [Gemmatimonadaceae bacterium]